MAKRPPGNKQLERIVRPVVEGQIRGFIKEHPGILKGVDWYKKPGSDKAKVLCGSLTKRIVMDLTCGTSAARLVAALVESESAVQPISTVALGTAAKRSWLARELAKIGRALCFTWKT